LDILGKNRMVNRCNWFITKLARN